MPKYEPGDFAAAVAAHACLMALDVSARRIGVAVTDPEWRMSLPAGTIRRGKWAADAAAIAAMIRARRVGGLVIGLPLNMDGSLGPAAQSRLTFARNLDAALAAAGVSLPYTMVDERLTTHSARGILAGRGAAHAAEDQIAAAQLLAQFLKI